MLKLFRQSLLQNLIESGDHRSRIVDQSRGDQRVVEYLLSDEFGDILVASIDGAQKLHIDRVLWIDLKNLRRHAFRGFAGVAVVKHLHHAAESTVFVVCHDGRGVRQTLRDFHLADLKLIQQLRLANSKVTYINSTNNIYYTLLAPKLSLIHEHSVDPCKSVRPSATSGSAVSVFFSKSTEEVSADTSLRPPNSFRLFMTKSSMVW